MHPEFSLDLLQTLSILTMERPVSFAAEDIRDEKVRAHLRVTTLSVLTMIPIDVMLGQGAQGDPAYRARGHATWPVCRCQRQARLPRR